MATHMEHRLSEEEVERAKESLQERVWHPHSLFPPPLPLRDELAVTPHSVPETPGAPFCRKLRTRIAWWQLHATPDVVRLITHGVGEGFPSEAFLRSVRPCPSKAKSPSEVEGALKVLEEYREAGAVVPIKAGSAPYLLPWFVVEKIEDSGETKLRLITDARKLNRFLNPTYFRLDNWSSILPHLEPGMFAFKVDLKHAYFHLPLARELSRLVCLEVGGQEFQFVAAPFGLNVLPQLWQNVMKTFLRKWRSVGIQVFIYLDDILVVGKSRGSLEKSKTLVLQDLESSGLTINRKKSQLEICQKLNHLGFCLNLKDGLLEIPPYKLKAAKRELGKLVRVQSMSARKLASVLGTVRSLLPAAPFLRAFTDVLSHLVKTYSLVSWDAVVPLPVQLRAEIRELKNIWEQWKGRNFGGKVVSKNVHSDSSDWGWGAPTNFGEKEKSFI